MSQGWDDYKKAADALPSEYLGSLFTGRAAAGAEGLSARALSLKSLFEENKILLGLDGGSIESQQARNSATGVRRKQDEEQREARRRNQSTGDYLALLDAQAQALQDRLDWIDNRMREIEEQIAQNTRKIEEHREFIDATKAEIEAYDRNGKFEFNADGTLKNRKAELDLQAYERRTGRSIDRTNAAELLDAMQEQAAWREQREAEYQQDNEDLEYEKDDLGKERQETKKQLDEVEAKQRVEEAEQEFERTSGVDEHKQNATITSLFAMQAEGQQAIDKMGEKPQSDDAPQNAPDLPKPGDTL